MSSTAIYILHRKSQETAGSYLKTPEEGPKLIRHSAGRLSLPQGPGPFCVELRA